MITCRKLLLFTLLIFFFACSTDKNIKPQVEEIPSNKDKNYKQVNLNEFRLNSDEENVQIKTEDYLDSEQREEARIQQLAEKFTSTDGSLDKAETENEEITVSEYDNSPSLNSGDEVLSSGKLDESALANDPFYTASPVFSDSKEDQPNESEEVIVQAEDENIDDSGDAADISPILASKQIEVDPSKIGLNGKTYNFGKPIDIYSNKKVERFIVLYTQEKRDLFIRGLKRSEKYYDMIASIFSEMKLPKELIFLAMVESNFNPKAVSRARAKGMWQFMKTTGDHFGLSQSWWHDERYDVEKSTRAAGTFLKQLHKRFNNWNHALAAYNSGPSRVSKAIRLNKKKGKSTDYWYLSLPRETRGYVPAFMAVNLIFKDLKKYGFNDNVNFKEYISYPSLKVPGSVALASISEQIGVSVKEIKSLNPSIIYNNTPAHFKSYTINVPHGFDVNEHGHVYALLEKKKIDTWMKHRIRSGDTLSSISRQYGIRISDIRSQNKNVRTRYLRIGSYIMIPFTNVKSKKKARSSTAVAQNKGSKKKFYKVRRGDTLIGIAKKFRVNVSALVNLNNSISTRNSIIKFGKLIRVY